jgi:hypothetical protein
MLSTLARLPAALLLAVAPLLAALPRFGDEAVNRFVAEADAAARASAPLTPEFWVWIERHPEVHAGLLFASHPMPAAHATNLELLRRAVKPAQADRYAALLLGVAVASADPLRTDPERAAPPSPAVAKVAEWMRSSGTTYLAVMTDTSAALAAAGVDPKDTREPGFWTKVAHASGTYPPRLAAAHTAHVRWLVDRLDEPAPEGAKQAWPIFPVARAPWPLLAWFRDVPPERERDWVWERYWGRVPGQPAGIIGYGRYSWDYDRVPAVKHKASPWHPNSLPRIWEDGGVCGRLSTMADTFRRTLGQPARGVGQPGHRAFMNYGWDAKKGVWTFGVGQSIAGIEATSGATGLASPFPWLENRAVSAQALVGAMNLGLDRWHRARILLWHARGLAPTAQERALREALALNPYELGAWRRLAELAEDPPALARTLARMDALLLDPDAGLEEAARLSAATDFAALGGGDPKARADVGNSVARVVGDALMLEHAKRLLDQGASRVELLGVVRREVERRAALKVPYGPAVALTLRTRLQVLADGPVGVLESIRAEALAADKLKGKTRDRAVEALGHRLAGVREAEAKVLADWSASLVGALAGSGRWTLDKSGKPVADRLLATVHDLRLHALRGKGKPLVEARVAATREFERGKPAPGVPAAPAR